jgi:hypothetical protein
VVKVTSQGAFGRTMVAEREMKTLLNSTRDVSLFVQLNMDRFLVPLLIVAALFLGGMLFSYATVS